MHEHQYCQVFCDNVRTGLRRLHVYFKCPVRSERCLETYDGDKVDDETFDAMCAICKHRLKAEQGHADSESSSSIDSSGDFSSTEVGQNGED